MWSCKGEGAVVVPLLWLPSFALSPSYFRTFAPLPSNFHLCKYELSASHLRFIAASSHFCLFAFATKKMREYDDIIAKLQRRIIDSSVSPSPLHFCNFAIAPSHFVSPRFTSHLYTLGSSPSYFHLYIGVSLHFRSFPIAFLPLQLRTFANAPLHFRLHISALHRRIFELLLFRLRTIHTLTSSTWRRRSKWPYRNSIVM